MSAIDHERIYLQPPCCANEDVGRLWCEDPDPTDCDDGKSWTEYVRADIYDQIVAERDHLRERVAELEAELPRAKAQAIREALDLPLKISAAFIDDEFKSGYTAAIDDFEVALFKIEGQSNG